MQIKHPLCAPYNPGGGTSATVVTPVAAVATGMNFRLTLASGDPVPITDQTAKTTVYLTPAGGNSIVLYIAGAWRTVQSAEVSIAIPATANTPFDVFAGDENNDGIVTLSTVDWATANTRAVALTRQDGILVGATPGRRYVGTLCTTGVAGQCEDSLTKRFVWNYNNRVQRPFYKTEATPSWNYNTAVYRIANNNPANIVEFVVGVIEEMVSVTAASQSGGANPTGTVGATAIGLDSVTVPAATNTQAASCGTGTFSNSAVSLLNFYPPTIGYHYCSWLEQGGTNPTTWIGNSLYGLNGFISG